MSGELLKALGAAEVEVFQKAHANTLEEPGGSLIQELDALCDESRFLDAHALLQEFGPPLGFRTAEALCVAARLVRHLGDEALSRTLALRAYRLEPNNPEARYWVGTLVLE